MTQVRTLLRTMGSSEAHRSVANTLRRREEPRPRCRRPAQQAVRLCASLPLLWAQTAHQSLASGNRPQPRPQMVVVENPPTMDDEGKMVRVHHTGQLLHCIAFGPYTAGGRCPTWPSAWLKSEKGKSAPERGPRGRAPPNAQETIFDLRRMRCSARWPFSGTCQCNVLCLRTRRVSA